LKCMASVRGAVVAEYPLLPLKLCPVVLLLAGLCASVTAQDFPIEPSPPSATTPAKQSVEPAQTATAKPAARAPPAQPAPRERKPPAKPKPAATAVAADAAPAKPTPAAPAVSNALPTVATAEPAATAAPPVSQAVPAAAALAEPAPVIEQSFVGVLEEVPTEAGPLVLLGESIESGSRHELRWALSQSFDGAVVTTPVIVLHGVKPGPRLCMTAAVHGDELNGIEIIRRVTNEIDVAELTGTVIAVPIVNYLGYSRASRYLPDRRDLNRYFPGSRGGSSASRIAYSFFNDVARHCHALVDFHTGSFDRSNLPQVRGDLRMDAVLAFTRDFGATAVLHSPGSNGMLRRALTNIGIPAITFEVGSPLRLEPSEIDFGVQAMHTLMHKMGMTRSFRMWAEPQALFYAAKWVRVDTGGMLFSEVKLGDRVRAGQRLGKVIDPMQNIETAIVAPVRGKVLGMALNQIVLPGFAVYHLGVETSEQRMAEEAARAAAQAGNGVVEEPAEDEDVGMPAERSPDDEEDER